MIFWGAQFCIFRNVSVKLIEHNFTFCFPLISEMVSHFIMEYVSFVWHWNQNGKKGGIISGTG